MLPLLTPVSRQDLAERTASMPNLQQIKQRVAEADAQQGTNGLMTSKVDAAVKGLLRNKLNPNQKWQKILVVDRSGSMGSAYPTHVQAVMDRDLGFSVLVDDDMKVPAIFFDNRLEELEISLDDFHNLLARKGIRARGTTDLTSALRRVAEITGNGDLFPQSSSRWGRSAPEPEPTIRPMKVPAFVTIVFDGRPDDPTTAMNAIRRMSWRAIEFKLLFVGRRFQDSAQKRPTPGWQFVVDLDDNIPVGVPFAQGGRLFDNVDAKSTESLAVMTDDEYYDAQFDEVPQALAAMRQHQLLVA